MRLFGYIFVTNQRAQIVYGPSNDAIRLGSTVSFLHR